MTVTQRATRSLSAVRRTVTPGGLNSTPERYSVSHEIVYNNGTADGQIDEVWKHAGSIAAAASDTHDLQSLTQLDDSGATIRAGISFIGIKDLIIKNTSDPALGGFLTIGEASANIWDGAGTPFSGGTGSTTGTIDLLPGDSFSWSSRTGGLVSGTSKDLDLAATTSTQTYELEITGEKT